MSFNVLILGSGRGSNAQALLAAERDGALGCATVEGIVSDIPDAGILQLGPQFGKPAHFLDPGRKGARFSPAGEADYIQFLQDQAPDLVVLAGFMRIVTPALIGAVNGRMINLHPSLLPSFPGLDGLGQAIAAGVRVAGCTVHWVTPALDAGPIIDQTAFRIDPAAPRAEANAALQKAEHSLLPDVVARISSGAIPLPSATHHA